MAYGVLRLKTAWKGTGALTTAPPRWPSVGFGWFGEGRIVNFCSSLENMIRSSALASWSPGQYLFPESSFSHTDLEAKMAYFV